MTEGSEQRTPPGADLSAQAGITPRQIKDTVQELLKYGLLEENRKPNLYKTALRHREEILPILEPLELSMKIDDVRGLVWLAVDASWLSENPQEEDEWTHPLVRRQRLNLEQSLLVAILRQHFVAYEQEAGVGAAGCKVLLDDLLPNLQLYLGDPGSDALAQKRLRGLLEQLKGHGLVSEVDSQEQVAIRPIIVHVANPENLQALLRTFRSHTNPGPDMAGPEDEI
ncbi:DUF4194 domain-containing protein [Brenneria tiliae]|uniref:DUF4194 domain-containing protein n=1 Tax=Brenneria tiliae TaxID=2914984 RepID=A0ABT0MTI5_9GAMM|nr:DUF4194 domain-containing protein [Brenneria tiliae]MCL2893144.1 DUF4194 domain-containing protein [Brenneria tiliae]